MSSFLQKVGLVAATLVAVNGMGPVFAAPAPTAWQLLDDGEPDKLKSAQLVYDRLRQLPVRVSSGGSEGPDHTWELDGDDWVRRFIPEPTPWDAAGGCLGYDSDRNVIVLFGGIFGVDETWEYDGSTWTQKNPTTVPPGRDQCRMVYDEANDKMIMFGGYSLNLSGLPDTWEYDGTDWTLVTPMVSPFPRGQHGMVYDVAAGKVLLFGGRHEGLVYSDMWEYDVQQQVWTQMIPGTSPPGRAGMGMAYDRGRDRTVVFGGLGQFAILGDTWEWDGQGWTQIAPTGSPSARLDMGLVYDEARGKIVGHGGGPDNGHYNDTWEYDGATWTEIALSGLPTVRARFAMAYDPVGDVIVMYGGKTDPPINDIPETWHFVNDRWVEQTTVGDPSGVFNWRLAYDEAGTRLVGFSGATDVSIVPAEVHEYDASPSVWLSMPACCPSERNSYGWAYAPPFGGVLMFGGHVSGATFLNDTWVLNGLNWTQHSPLNRPAARESTGMAYAPTLGKAVLYGGTTNGAFSGAKADTWLYDGADWQRLFATSAPGARLGLDLIHDPVRNLIVMYGNGAPLEGVTWEFDGSQWTARTTPTQPDTDRCDSQMAYDSRREVVILFGGVKCASGIYFNDTWAYGEDPDGDGIVGGLDNCRDTPNADQANQDGDPAGDLCDCAAADPGSYSPAAEVTGLAVDGDTITWDDQAPSVGSGVTYDLVSGGLQDLRASGNFSASQCLGPDLAVASYTDNRTPSPADGFYYLARATNTCATASYGPGRGGLDTGSPCP